jgi:FkbM family methyltransferase
MKNSLGALALGALRAYARITPTQRGGYRLARLARRMVPREQWLQRFPIPGGAQFGLDLATYPDCCMAVGLYELDTLRLLRALLKPGDHFVDCGANIGYFTFAAVKAVGPAGRVDAFEPDPVNRTRLEENLAANGSPANVHVHPVALSDHSGEATLYHPEQASRNHGEASLFASADVASTPYKVKLARLDEEIDRTPQFIKMDIEGAELLALKGMSALLKAERPPMLIIEHNPESAATAGHRSGDLLRFLQTCQPRYRARWAGWRLSTCKSAEQIDRATRQGNFLYRVE